MGFWSKLFGMDKVVEKGMDLADKAIYTQQERAESDSADLKEAREMTAPSHSSWLDVLVDGFSRLIRPGVTLWLVGGFTGWWKLPQSEDISDYWMNTFTIVLTFWFGGRAILKDLPGAVRAMRGK